MPPDTAGDSGEGDSSGKLEGLGCQLPRLETSSPTSPCPDVYLRTPGKGMSDRSHSVSSSYHFLPCQMCVCRFLCLPTWLAGGCMLACPTSPDCMPQLSLSTPEKGHEAQRYCGPPQASTRDRCEHKLFFLQLHHLKGQLRKEACPWRKLGPMVPAGRGLSSQDHAASTLP